MAIDQLQAATPKGFKLETTLSEFGFLAIGDPPDNILVGPTVSPVEALRDPLTRAGAGCDEVHFIEGHVWSVIQVDRQLEGKEATERRVPHQKAEHRFKGAGLAYSLVDLVVKHPAHQLEMLLMLALPPSLRHRRDYVSGRVEPSSATYVLAQDLTVVPGLE